MEICSEAGAVWVEVDLEEGTDDPTAPCPKCADCALCAVTGTAPLPDLPEMARVGYVQYVRNQTRDLYYSYNSDWLWPATRGPPFAPQDRTERAPRASMAVTPFIGGAPWS
ncbi:hypothetical protein HW561_02840 [Rhodobacteraceae bacterium B1Z28]|uniref:Uncharacterized protein n=1 Tax=Ruegeria haliotis TaxID=2747601 RepID=A0ABX2PMQ4_9RHOB|nr:hypothetical protein [Ruegeria haliotis]